jgi:toxin HigB-1
MIGKFKNKALEDIFTKGRSKKVPQERIAKIKNILTVLSAATNLKDVDNPGYRLHRLKKPPYDGFWSIDVNGNYRIVFRFEDSKVVDLDYLDTH